MKSEVISVRYRDGAFVPLTPKKVGEKFKEGDVLSIRIVRDRYWPGHKAFMALINDAFETMPDELRKEYTNPDILRRRLLIASGYATVDSVVCANDEEATKTAYKISKFTDDHTFLSLRDNIVVIARAHSQAMDKMKDDTFKRSCNSCIVQLEMLLGCSKDDIRLHAQSLKGNSSS